MSKVEMMSGEQRVAWNCSASLISSVPLDTDIICCGLAAAAVRYGLDFVAASFVPSKDSVRWAEGGLELFSEVDIFCSFRNFISVVVIWQQQQQQLCVVMIWSQQQQQQ